jgi:hypothetical protein
MSHRQQGFCRRCFVSKNAKRVGLAALLLCLCVAGANVYRRLTGAPVGAPPPVAAPRVASAPAERNPPPPPVAPAAPAPAVPAAESDTTALASQSESRGGARKRVRRARREETPSIAGKSDEGAAPLAADVQPAAPAPADTPAAPAVAPAADAAPAPKAGSHISIRIRPKLGPTVQDFQIVKVTALIDGRTICVAEGKGFEPDKGLEVFRGNLEAGEHTLNVLAEYRGNGHSVFSYFDRYRYTARSSTQLRAEEGGKLEITVDLVDRGGANTAFEERLVIAFLQR